MNEAELLARVEAIRREPLRVCCRTSDGQLIETTLAQCVAQHCKYFHIVADELDTLLERELK